MKAKQEKKILIRGSATDGTIVAIGMLIDLLSSLFIGCVLEGKTDCYNKSSLVDNEIVIIFVSGN